MKKEQIIHLQKSLGVEADGILGPITRTAYVNKLISIFSKEVGIKETSRNRGDGIEKYWTACDYSEGYVHRSPYCAAAISWVIKQSGCFSEYDRPKTAGAFAYEEWANRVGMNVIKPVKSVKRGDLIILSISHIGLSTSDSDANGNFSTIEANTGPSGGRDGDGVYAKRRNISCLRSVIRL